MIRFALSPCTEHSHSPRAAAGGERLVVRRPRQHRRLALRELELADLRSLSVGRLPQEHAAVQPCRREQEPARLVRQCRQVLPRRALRASAACFLPVPSGPPGSPRRTPPGRRRSRGSVRSNPTRARAPSSGSPTSGDRAMCRSTRSEPSRPGCRGRGFCRPGSTPSPAATPSTPSTSTGSVPLRRVVGRRRSVGEHVR